VNTVKKDSGLYAYRRHLRTCPFFGPGGRDVRNDKCNCPFHIDGLHNGRRERGSLKTRSRQVADRRLADRVRQLDAQLADAYRAADSAASGQGLPPVTLADAVARFLKTHGEIGPDGKYTGDSERATWKKYRCALVLLAAFWERKGIGSLVDVTADVLEDYRGSRTVGKVTWKVERQMLITFFHFCIRRKWITANPAKELKAPRNIKPNGIVPYTMLEESQILAACDQIGGGRYNRSGARYEQLRARAMIILLRATALRVSDVSTFRKDAVSWDAGIGTWRLLVRTQKTGDPVFLPIPENLKLVLDALPVPRNAPQDCPYYFWNGQSSRRAVVGIAERSLSAVFKKSGVKNAHAHRYRHTLATRLLEQGATFEEVADILGNSPAVVRKHYAKWAKGRQTNIDRLMMAHFQTGVATNPVTRQSHEKMEPVN
jgi:site-specific recombinase XerD